ncbi:hypothetical protein [Pedobacter ureilyticus]|uniref:Uncharacterized protein n=1 Tax=Pedobacter ureilyticus TaxID=1393051 RepID=A0ABW9J8V5_9SPHI|nr:hypothetical protein [Pedobacter helvus]
MKTLIIISCILFGVLQTTPVKIKVKPEVTQIQQANRIPRLQIYFPKNGQKVRGRYSIYGYTEPNMKLKVQITSTYYEKLYNNQKETISKGKGPINRINRSYPLTANSIGYWELKDIDLTNRNWEEDFTIKAIVEGRTATISVYDHTHPIVID